MRKSLKATKSAVRQSDPLQIFTLSRSVRAPLALARRKDAEARWATWDVARRIIEHASRADVLTASQRLNPNGPTGGRPRSPHVVIMEVLAPEIGVCQRTLERWMAEWLAVAPLLGVSPGCPSKEFRDMMSRNQKPEQVEALLERACSEKQEHQTGHPGAEKRAKKAGNGNGNGSGGGAAPAPYAVRDGASAATRTILVGPSPAEAQRHLLALSNASNLMEMLREGIVLALATGATRAEQPAQSAPNGTYRPSLRAKDALKTLGYEDEATVAALHRAATELPDVAAKADPKAVGLGESDALAADGTLIKHALLSLAPSALGSVVRAVKMVRGRAKRGSKKGGRKCA